MRRFSIIAAVMLLGAAPLAAAEDPNENSDWGRCQAFYASGSGNEESNETVHNTPAFEDTDDSCGDETSPPYAETPAEEHAGEDPGKNGQDPGGQAPDDPGPPEDPGNPPSDPGPPDDDQGSQGDRAGVSFLP